MGKFEFEKDMAKKRRFGTVTGLLLFCATMAGGFLHAQQQWNIAVQGGVGSVVNTFVGYEEMISTSNYPIVDLRIGYQTTENDHPYAQLYRYPNFGFSFGWMGLSKLEYNGESHLGSVVNISGFMEGDLVRVPRFSVGYDGQIGFGLCDGIHDPIFNPLNTAVSSPLLIFARLGLKAFSLINKQSGMLTEGSSGDNRKAPGYIIPLLARNCSWYSS